MLQHHSMHSSTHVPPSIHVSTCLHVCTAPRRPTSHIPFIGRRVDVETGRGKKELGNVGVTVARGQNPGGVPVAGGPCVRGRPCMCAHVCLRAHMAVHTLTHTHTHTHRQTHTCNSTWSYTTHNYYSTILLCCIITAWHCLVLHRIGPHGSTEPQTDHALT